MLKLKIYPKNYKLMPTHENYLVTSYVPSELSTMKKPARYMIYMHVSYMSMQRL